eukprot:169003_1
MSHSSSVNGSAVHTILYINGTATLLIVLLCTHFIYNICIQNRTVATTIRIKINNHCHFKTVSIIQTFIFILSLTSCIIGTLFISNLMLSATSSTTCNTIYPILYCCWFIARYLVILMFTFRLLEWVMSRKCKKLLVCIALITTFINIAIIITYGYITSPFLIDIQSLNIILCTDETQWLNRTENSFNVSYLILNSINILIIIIIFGIYIHQIHLVKTHNITSVFAYSYQSLSSTNKLYSKEKQSNNIINKINKSEIDDEKTNLSSSNSSDVISAAIAATLSNKEVTIGANRRKRNYTSNQSSNTSNPKSFIPKPEIFNTNNDKVLTKNSKMEQHANELVKIRTKKLDEHTIITLTVKQNTNNDVNKKDTNDTKNEQYIEDLRFVVQKQFIFQIIFVFMVIIDLFPIEFTDNKPVIDLYLNAINSFVNCLCSIMLFHCYNDVWYDIMRCLQCYCFYDCCWKHFNCFICDNHRNCYTFCCKSCVKQKVQCNDETIDDNKMNGNTVGLNKNEEITENGNKKNDQQKSIYVRGSLRRLHQK